MQGDGLNDGFKICEHFVIPESHQFHATICKITRSVEIVLPGFRGVVLTAIQFDSQFQRLAIKVENIRCEGVLTTKF